MMINDTIVYWLPFVILVGMWAWFIFQMKKSRPFEDIRKTNSEIQSSNQEIIRLLKEIKDTLENRKS
jgi:penicillin-binding protein-related factor A (putative recombinase)